MSQHDNFPYNGNQVNSPWQSSNTFGPLGPPPGAANTSFQQTRTTDAPTPLYHGEALARSPFLERYGGWIVFSFTGAFALFLIIMNLIGQKPGISIPLKSISDVLQFAGESIGLSFALIITSRLWRASTQLTQGLRQLEAQTGRKNSELVAARSEAHNARRAFLSWTFLSIAVAVYASGQATWTFFDVFAPPAPYPGLYDIGFVSSYPFFLIGALLLTRRSNRATVGRVRLLLDAFAVIGAAMALSWFFAFGPSINSLPGQPFLLGFLTIYFPGGDLLLVALGAFLMFSPLSTREQQPVFMRLCLGLFFLAVTDSMLVWLSIPPSVFNTGTIQDTLWPLSLMMVGLAAVAYPQSSAREQERIARQSNRAGDLSIAVSRFSALSLTLQTVAPFILALGTSTVLLTIVPIQFKNQATVAAVIALILFLIVAIRQALTLNENNRLRMQLAGELVLSRRELQVTRREADDATREVQDKQRLEQGVAALQTVHARIASGDFSIRASTDPGPLQTVAVSLNLVIERLKDLAVRASRYDQLVNESRTIQSALEHLSQGVTAWSTATAPNSKTELRPIFLGVERVQRFQLMQWKSLLSALERAAQPIGRIRTALEIAEQVNNHSFESEGEKNPASGSVTQLEQQLQRLIAQTRGLIERLEGQASQPAVSVTPLPEAYQPRPEIGYKSRDLQTPRPQGRFSFEEANQGQGNANEFPRFPSRPGSIPQRPGKGQDSSSLV